MPQKKLQPRPVAARSGNNTSNQPTPLQPSSRTQSGPREVVPRTANQPTPLQSSSRTQSSQAGARLTKSQEVAEPSPVRVRPTVPPVIEQIDDVELEWASTTIEVLSAKLSMAIETITDINQAEKLQPYVNQLRQLKLETTKALNYVHIKPVQGEPREDKFGKVKVMTICGFQDSLAVIDAFGEWIKRNPSPNQFEEVVKIIRGIKDTL